MTRRCGPRFLVLAADLGETGGIGTAMRDFIRALAALYGPGRCHVLSVRAGLPLDDLAADILDAGSSTKTSRISIFRQIQFGVRSLAAAYRYRTGLIVVAAHPNLATLAWLSAAVARSPFVCWIFGMESWVPLPRFVRMALRKALLVLSITNFTATNAARAQGISPDRIRVIPLAVSTRRRILGDVQRDARTVLTVARLNRADAYKGVDTLIRVWPAVLREVPEAKLTIVGEGNDRTRLESEALDRQLTHSIKFVGFVPEERLDEFYAAAAIFALPGRCTIGERAEGEGFGLVFIEAAAAGLPVVAGRAGGAVEAVLDNEGGMLVDPEDDDEIIRAIVRLLRSDSERQRMGRTAKRFVEDRFTFDNFCASLLQAFDHVTRCCLFHTGAAS